jgi:DNA-binding SARP family transcriptional activator/basic membrane lipoprotein Med (substrate-binding protein (PBP1-ABC) superfamily)
LKVFLAGRIAVEAEGVVTDERQFPGRQGRLLFAYLVSEHGRPVPRDELADVLWGDAPPATWDKALSVLVSKLRGVLAESGLDGARTLTAAFGCYQLELPEGTWIDVLAADNAAKEAEGFLERDELESATAAATLAESVTRSPFLPGDDGPWVEEKRRELAEVRARALSALAEASLRTDRAAEAVRWAALAIEAEPFRESGYRRLMEAHVAAGNRGEALQVYERCRRLLAEELGAYPSPETESIYRSLLEAPSGRAPVKTAATSAPGSAVARTRRRKVPAVVAALVILVALLGTAGIFVATRGDGSKAASGVAARPRVALVVADVPTAADDPSAQYVDAFERWRTEEGISTQVLRINLGKGLSPGERKSIDSFGLVLLAGQFVGNHFVHEFARHPHTRFVVLEPDPAHGPLFDAVSASPNASDLFFVEGPGAYLAGYFSALVAKQSSGNRPLAVSMIGSYPPLDENVIDPFASGARDAVHGIRVFEQESHDLLHPSVCEAIANDQIDRGSRVVYADAGSCSAGALSAAESRGVRGVAGDQDPSNPDLEWQILAYTVKNRKQLVDYVIRHYLEDTLPHRHHFDIGIERGAVGFVITNPHVRASIRATIERIKSENMKRWAARATPQN